MEIRPCKEDVGENGDKDPCFLNVDGGETASCFGQFVLETPPPQLNCTLAGPRACLYCIQKEKISCTSHGSSFDSLSVQPVA